MSTNRRSTIKAKTVVVQEEDDFFLKAIKAKGFCHVSFSSGV